MKGERQEWSFRIRLTRHGLGLQGDQEAGVLRPLGLFGPQRDVARLTEQDELLLARPRRLFVGIELKDIATGDGREGAIEKLLRFPHLRLPESHQVRFGRRGRGVQRDRTQGAQAPSAGQDLFVDPKEPPRFLSEVSGDSSLDHMQFRHPLLVPSLKNMDLGAAEANRQQVECSLVDCPV